MHFKIDFGIDFTDSKGLTQGHPVNWKSNTVKNCTRRAPQLHISRNVTNYRKKQHKINKKNMEDLLKDIFLL